jgi:hypothetical protein
MKGKSYNYLATQLEKGNFEYNARVTKMIFIQLLLKAAIKAWGIDATNATKAEMKAPLAELLHAKAVEQTIS